MYVCESVRVPSVCAALLSHQWRAEPSRHFISGFFTAVQTGTHLNAFLLGREVLNHPHRNNPIVKRAESVRAEATPSLPSSVKSPQ